jgi:NNP family nitrate/nitrite transporter-like MFS transporter
MTEPSPGALNLFRLEPRIKILHLTWLAFFVSFFVWFNHAPLMAAIRASLHLTDAQVSALLILNVALTIPARIVCGMLVDKLGPRLLFALLLAISGGLCIFFGLAQSFQTLAIARFLLAFVGAGFVVGIRMIGEWFPAKQAGFAQGIYAGFGNFGSAAAAVTLPSVAAWVGGPDGWRWAIILTGAISIAYAGVYYLATSDTPKGSTYFKPKKTGSMEVTSRGDFVLYAILQAPLALALALLAWKLGPFGLDMLSPALTNSIYGGLAALYAYQLYDMWRINAPVMRGEIVPEIWNGEDYRLRLRICRGTRGSSGAGGQARAGRHARLHRARISSRRSANGSLRHLFARRDRVRDAHWKTALRSRLFE